MKTIKTFKTFNESATKEYYHDEIEKGMRDFSNEKYFLVTDKSGRSMKPYKLNKTDIEQSWDLTEEDWDTEQTLSDFLENSSFGDFWNTQSVEFECISE